jgi:DNA-binding MarR family transcriptional regulator
MPTTAGKSDLWIKEILDNLRRVFQVVHGYSKRAERVAGLTGPQLWALKVLSESAPIRVSDLARRMYLQPPTVVGILDRLEQQGQVKRTRLAEDHRVVEVSLTEKGKGTLSKVPQVAQGLLLTGLKGLDVKQLETVSEGLELLVGILGARNTPPQLLFSKGVNAPRRFGRGRNPGKPKTRST